MATKHDQLMKELIASFSFQFLRLAAPRIAAKVHLDSVEFVPEEHYPGSPTGRARRADLIARAHILPVGMEGSSGRQKEVLLHVESELRYRGITAARLLNYHRGLSLKYAIVVHTIVLYLRGGPPGSQSAIYEEASLGETVVTFRYYSLGLSQARATEYLARPEPLAWALAALMRPEKGQSRARLGLTCMQQIAGASDLDRRHKEMLFSCVWMYGRFKDDEAQEFDRIMVESEDEEVREMQGSMFDWWKRQGLEEGIRQGEASLLRRLLRRRFDQLPKWIDQRLEQATRQDLETWADRVLDAKRLEDVFSSA